MTVPEEKLTTLFLGIAIDLEEALRASMKRLDIKFTGAGMSGVRVKLGKDKLIISMPDYLEYIEYGRHNPTTPEELELWVNTKILNNYKGKPEAKARALKRITENIAEKITKFGPRPRPFIRPVLHTELPEIIKNNVTRFSD